MIAQCEERLRPIGQKAGNALLLACLTLVAPHLTPADREEWVRVAAASLSGIPADLMEDACAAARLTSRFPSDIVPTIAAHANAGWNGWERRKRALSEARQIVAARNTPRLADYVTLNEAQSIIAETMAKWAK